ncbi:MAG: hypothetical protein AAGC96_00065 [Pseudomonadota bacterium]
MKPRRRQPLMAALRAELAHFAVLCIMVLAIPLVLPLAKAHAFLSGITICTQSGITADTEKPGPLNMHADCDCVLTCHSCLSVKVAKALQTGWALAVATPDTAAMWLPGLASRLLEDADARAANAIRGPPVSV